MDLLQFQKPQRYIGNEWNVIKKSHQDKISICLCYPEIYEVGMSNLGLRILYGLFNELDDVVCERVFMPAEDYHQYLELHQKPLTSLDTKTRLCDFNILGFNLNYELNFVNFLHILNLGGVPLEKTKRKDIIVMGGGIANPEPLAEFVDVFYLGEFEDGAYKFIEVLRKYKDKKSRLHALSEIDGFYIPEFYSVTFSHNRYNFAKIYPHAQFPIKKVFIKDLDNSYYPRNWLTPHTEIIHDRVPIEIARGCPNRCNFCQARNIYYPYRERKALTIKNIIKKIYDNSGYENFSFLSLSASDYSSIEKLVDETIDYFQDKKIGLFLPSLRIDDITGNLYKKLIPLKKASITLAVEAATNSLRSHINKKIEIDKLFEAAKIINSLKINHIKLYFMFGFPQEGEDDLIAISKFLEKLRIESKLYLNVSINIFIPKPFSLWENITMEEENILEEKRKIILKNAYFHKNIKISLSNTKKSILEGIISRADRQFSKVILQVYKSGMFFKDSQEKFPWEIWEEAMKKENIDYRFYLDAKTENFPWSFITR